MMSRRLYCQKCDSLVGDFCQQDVEAGWKQRRTVVIAKKPAEHFLTVTTNDPAQPPQRFDLDSLFCDLCGDAIPDGTEAMAITEWCNQAEPERWEDQMQTLPAFSSPSPINPQPPTDP